MSVAFRGYGDYIASNKVAYFVLLLLKIHNREHSDINSLFFYEIIHYMICRRDHPKTFSLHLRIWTPRGVGGVGAAFFTFLLHLRIWTPRGVGGVGEACCNWPPAIKSHGACAGNNIAIISRLKQFYGDAPAIND